MYQGKRKGIIIFIVIIVLIIVILGVGGYLYLKTDLFKSNQELFLKYIGQTMDNIKYQENVQQKDILKMMNEKPYEISGAVKLNYEENEAVAIKSLEGLEIEVKGRGNKAYDKSYASMIGKFKNQDIFKVEYINSNNVAALRNDEIVQNYYVGVRNENLNILLQKLDNIFTNPNILPDVITNIDLNELLTISEQEISNIKEVYTDVIINNISKDKYTKHSDITVQKNNVTYVANGYRLDLTQEEVKDVLIKMLEELKQDSVTLNLIATKSKILSGDSDYSNVNSLTRTIDREILNIKMSNMFENGISITVYEKNGEVILTEILIKNKIKITLSGKSDISKNEYNIKIENLNNDEEFQLYEISFVETKKEGQTTLQLLFNKDNKYGIEIYAEDVGKAIDGTINSNYEVIINNEDKKTTINYEQEMKFVDEIENIEDLNNTNCSVLNDYTKEQLVPFTTALIDRIKYVVNEKIKIISQ